jgi:hypothetical protein
MTLTANLLSMAVEVAAAVPQRIMTPLEMVATPFTEQAEAEEAVERASPTLARVVAGEHILQAGAVLVAHPAVPLARLAEITYLGVAMEVVAGRVVPVLTEEQAVLAEYLAEEEQEAEAVTITTVASGVQAHAAKSGFGRIR